MAKELVRACSGLRMVLALKRDLDGSGGDRALSPTAGLGGDGAAGELKPKRNSCCPDLVAARRATGAKALLLDEVPS